METKAIFLDELVCFSVTVEECRSASCGRRFLDVRAHGLTEAFEESKMILNVYPLDNGENCYEKIVGIINSSISQWIPSAVMQFPISDGSSGMSKAVTDLSLEWLYCLAHVMNGIVKKAISAYDELCTVVAKSRAICRSIKNSTKLMSIFQQVRKENDGSEISRLLPEIPSRWDSTARMLQSVLHNSALIEKLYDSISSSEAELVENWKPLNESEKRLADEAVAVLYSCEKVTSEATLDNECISAYLAILNNLRSSLLCLSDDFNTSKIVIPFINGLLKELDSQCFGKKNDVRQISSLRIAILLDPRYAYNFSIFSKNDWQSCELKTAEKGVDLILKTKKIALCRKGDVISNTSENVPQTSTTALGGGLNNTGGSNKTERVCQKKCDKCAHIGRLTSPSRRKPLPSMMAVLDYEYHIGDTDFGTEREYLNGIVQDEISRYRQLVKSSTMPPYATFDDIAEFWTSKKAVLPNLYALARRYLGVPLGSLDAERLLSVISSIVSNNGLEVPERSSMLLLKEFHYKGSDSIFVPLSFNVFDDDADVILPSGSA